MRFEDIVGQEVVVKSLQKAISLDRVSHAYLFSGPRGSGKKTLAALFTRALNCSAEKESPPCEHCLSCRKNLSGNHPDVFELQPEGASLKIDQLREIKERLFYFPREGSRKVCLIQEADLLTLPAANSILKILEEPPQDLVFLLISSRPWALLPTVISRCVHFPLRPLSEEEVFHLLKQRTELGQKERELVVSMAGGIPGQALEMAAGDEWKKRYEKVCSLVEEIEAAPVEVLFKRAEEYAVSDDLLEVLDMMARVYRDRLLGCYLENRREKPPDQKAEQFSQRDKRKERRRGSLQPLFGERICRELLRVRDQLPQNVNRRLALETLFLKMRGVV